MVSFFSPLMDFRSLVYLTLVIFLFFAIESLFLSYTYSRVTSSLHTVHDFIICIPLLIVIFYL